MGDDAIWFMVASITIFIGWFGMLHNQTKPNQNEMKCTRLIKVEECA